jgi:hypothetical protein
LNRSFQTAFWAIRIGLFWWILPTVLLSVLFGATAWLFFGFFLFPIMAILLAGYGSWAQRRAFQAFPFAPHLGVSHRATIPLPFTLAEAETSVAEILQGDLAATSFSVRGRTMMAAFQPPAWRGAFRKWLESDELVIELQAPPSSKGGHRGCTLEVKAQPVSWVWRLEVWIDRGRNYARLQAFQEALSARVAEDARQKDSLRHADTVEARLAQAELLLLRAQVEPHFLFNTLAHLRELIRTGESASAVLMLDHLTAYSRSVSERIRQATHRLAQELEATQAYLSLMQIRFGDRLHFQVQVDPEAMACEVPVGSLLIPVENAIKHGIEPRSAPGTVEIRGVIDQEILCLDIQDDGVGLQPDSGTSRGTGLANLRERLKLSFAKDAGLTIEGQEAGGVRVHVRMPVWKRPQP